MKNRLKLYDTLLKVYLPKSEKNKLRRIAFSKKMTLSQYTRELIKLSLAIEDYRKNSCKQENNSDKIDRILGGLLNN